MIMLKMHLKLLTWILILGVFSLFQPLYGQGYTYKKNEYYLIIDRCDLEYIIQNVQQLNFSSYGGPFVEVEEIKKEFASLLASPGEVKYDEGIAADVEAEDLEGTVPLPHSSKINPLMDSLLRNLEKPMDLSPKIPITYFN